MKLTTATLLGMLAFEGAHAFTTSAKPAFARIAATQCSATLEGRRIEGEVKPINNFILVKVADVESESAGGILLSEKAQIVKTQGTVVSVGPGKTHQESGIYFKMPVEPGESVVYGKYDGTEVEYNGETHTLIRDDDVLIKYKGELTLDNTESVADNVLVYVENQEEETAGGLLFAQSSSKDAKPSTGEVVKVGPGRMASSGELIKMGVNIGDTIKFRDFAGNEVEIEGKEYSVVRMPDILAKF